MTSFDLSRLEAVFSTTAALPTPEAREAYLQELAGENAELVAEVRKLLANQQSANKFFEAPHDQRLRMLMTTLGNQSYVLETEVGEFLRQAWPPQQPDEVARLSDHFALHELVAVGSTGFLFRGYDCHLNRTVAIKALAPSVSRDPQRKSAFIEEARLASRIKHPNVVTIYHVDPGTTERPNAFIAMEWLDGQNLQQWLEQDPQSVRLRAPQLIAQMSAGLAAIHAQRIVHRDIKPGNLLFEKQTGRLVIVDFGLAFESGVTEALFLPAGTPLYMSPEQVMGQKPTDHSDQFSLAVVAFQILTGLHPFAGQSVAELLEHIKRGELNLESNAHRLSSGALQVFRKAFAPLPADRYHTVEHFYQALRQVVKALPGLPSGNAATMALEDFNKTKSRSVWRQWTKDPAAIGLGLAIVALATLGLGYLWYAGNRPFDNGRPDPTESADNGSEGRSSESSATGDKANSDQAQGWRWLDEHTMVNRFDIEFTKVPPPSDSIVDGLRASFENHPEYTDGLDWRNWTQPYLISSSPITFRQYLSVMKHAPKTIQQNGIPYDLDAPVTHVFYREMRQFCEKLNELEGLNELKGLVGRQGYSIASHQQWSFAAYGDAMLSAPADAEKIEARLLQNAPNASPARQGSNELLRENDSDANAHWIEKLHLRHPIGPYWELTSTQKPTLQELDGLIPLHDWGRRRNAEEFVVVGRPTEDLQLHWFDLHNGCNNHFVSMENLMPYTESDGETSYMHPIEFGKPGMVTYRYQTDGPIITAAIQSGLFIYHVGDEGGVRIRGRRSDRDPPLAEQAWVDAINAKGVYDKTLTIDITDIVQGMREFEIQYWVVNRIEPKHYAQIFRGVLWKREARVPTCFVSLTTQRPEASIKATGPIPEHFVDPRITFRISLDLPRPSDE